MNKVILLLVAFVAIASAHIYFQETFDEDTVPSKWVSSKTREADGSQGKWDISHGKYYNDAQKDKGLHTTDDARFYQISAPIEKFSNKGKDLILQYSVKHEQRIDCGGAYIKLLPGPLDQEKFNGDSAYNVMFGPDICGSSTKKTHVILSNEGKNHLVKKEVKAETDEWTHLYTLVIKPDNSYTVYIDSKEVSTGNFRDDFDILAPKQIKDPQAKKPADWVDAKTIADPTDKKPEGYDDIPAEIVDPEATKPADWDDELDGEWEAPMIDNPDFKGEWSPKMIENPEYKGEWIHPLVDNPDFKDNENIYAFDDHSFIGFEIWQVKAGTIFDNIIVTDDKAEADKFAELTKATQEGEKKMFDKEEEERRAKEAAEKTDEPEEDEHAGHEHDKDEL